MPHSVSFQLGFYCLPNTSLKLSRIRSCSTKCLLQPQGGICRLCFSSYYLTSFKKPVSPLAAKAFGSAIVLFTLPLILKKNVIKAVKVVHERFKSAKQLCNMQERLKRILLIPCRLRCLSKLFRPIMVSFTIHFQLHPIKPLKCC